MTPDERIIANLQERLGSVRKRGTILRQELEKNRRQELELSEELERLQRLRNLRSWVIP